jgi:chorismate mutase-like protein
MDIEHWRTKIDEVNRKLLKLLNERAGYALEVGHAKTANGQAIYDPARETAVLNQLRSLNEGPLSHEAVERIFKQIIDEARRLEQENHADSQNKKPHEG